MKLLTNVKFLMKLIPIFQTIDTVWIMFIQIDYLNIFIYYYYYIYILFNKF